MMFTVLIPARYASTRLPGKPLLDIMGKPMVVRVAERARASGADRVVVATDDERIRMAASQHGIDEFRGAGPKLSAQPAFVEAEKLSGMPDEITGFAYANVKAALPVLALAGVKLPAELPDFRSLLAFGSQGQDERTFTTYIQVGSS